MKNGTFFATPSADNWFLIECGNEKKIKFFRFKHTHMHTSCSDAFLCILQPLNNAPAVFTQHLWFIFHRFLHYRLTTCRL